MIEIKKITKTFQDSSKKNVNVLNGIDISISNNEFVTIIGPNGCGKSTLLNLIAGLTKSDNGAIEINNKAPQESKIGFVFQNYRESLFPWLKNIDNIAFSLKKSFGNKKQKRKYVLDFLNDFDLIDYPLYKYPYQCSGGQQQLTVFLRELIYEPDVLILDEPFASLDYERKMQQQKTLLDFWRKMKTTIVMVSHEIEESIYLSDKVILLTNRPATVHKTYDIELKRPRNLNILQSDEFFKFKVEILKDFLTIIN